MKKLIWIVILIMVVGIGYWLVKVSVPDKFVSLEISSTPGDIEVSKATQSLFSVDVRSNVTGGVSIKSVTFQLQGPSADFSDIFLEDAEGRKISSNQETVNFDDSNSVKKIKLDLLGDYRLVSTDKFNLVAYINNFTPRADAYKIILEEIVVVDSIVSRIDILGLPIEHSLPSSNG